MKDYSFSPNREEWEVIELRTTIMDGEKTFNNEEQYECSLTEPFVLRFIKPIMT
ncbi:hypothetical protein [Prevotella aurantiaca]|uniref:hypothetical protein n=1 Tax=Prevotella aurantiaca TaxID=596085 RepID=UPI0028E655A5|nr:hypothetical protein [Prevotella aurantiaca]